MNNDRHLTNHEIDAALRELNRACTAELVQFPIERRVREPRMPHELSRADARLVRVLAVLVALSYGCIGVLAWMLR